MLKLMSWSEQLSVLAMYNCSMTHQHPHLLSKLDIFQEQEPPLVGR